MKPVILAVATVLFSAAASLALGPDWVECRIGDLGVPMPRGDGWELSQNDSGAWIAARVRRTLAGAPVTLELVLVEEYQAPAIYADWLPVELATDYLLWEIETMETEGVAKGDYTLADLDVFDAQHGGRTLHALRNVKAYLAPWHPDLVLEAQELYLAFLPDFPATTRFYKIFLTADCFFPECDLSDLDLSEMYPVLDGLRDYSAPSD